MKLLLLMTIGYHDTFGWSQQRHNKREALHWKIPTQYKGQVETVRYSVTMLVPPKVAYIVQSPPSGRIPIFSGSLLS